MPPPPATPSGPEAGGAAPAGAQPVQPAPGQRVLDARPYAAPARRAHPAVVTARKVLMAFLALSLFVFAIALLKTGAQGIAPVAHQVFKVGNPLSAMGFGWGLAYLVLSGSPIAATALGLFSAGVLDRLGAFMMIAGSRFGAAFIVLLIGFVYTLRQPGRYRLQTLSLHAGVMSLLVTYTVYAPGTAIGYVLLISGVLEPYAITTPPRFLDLLDATFGRGAEVYAGLVPHAGLVFATGLGAVLASFKLFDAALPDVKGRAGRLGRMAERIYRPSVLFAFGFAITMLTLSVSVSLSLLVPLTVKGIIRRENLIPYIMGANVSTFIDTLFASVVVGGAAAFTVVLAEMAGVALVSLFIILFAYSWYEESIYRLSGAILRDRRRMGLFVTVILICPVLFWLL